MINEILEDKSITEIVFSNTSDVLIEHKGSLSCVESVWRSEEEKGEFENQVINALPKAPNYEHPMASGIWKNFRVQAVCPPAVSEGLLLQLRRIPDLDDFSSFNINDWDCDEEALNILKEKFEVEKENFLIVGATGCGKTTLLKSLITTYCKKERVICIEDSPELPKVNKLSCNLKTYVSSMPEVKDIELKDLVKTSLRMRPDRLIMGEMRGEEASSFLLMLSTGHKGSGATLHAHTSIDALYRLEMLTQMGSPWPVQTIRKLIHTALNFIIVMGRDPNTGQRFIKNIDEIVGLESEGFLIHPLYTREGEQDFI